MLDSTTRKRIDDCRDILVGKLPDPKAQIEQITIGLIYKFMDDMDKEAIELGGKPKFFSNFKLPDPDHPDDRSKDKLVQFEQYRWDNLFNSKVTASEMLRLYSEAIENMEKNPNIPQLFRDIFNNAYLPYRDPETLKMFLKTIGEFEYTHSEKLGDAFEYLLQVMGSQGDAGQFRTPRHIIDFLVAIVDPGKNDTILDPACGTAGFLISAYKHILLKNAKANEKGLDIYSFNNKNEKPLFNNLGDDLTPDQKKKLVQNFAGYDISPDMVRLSLVNLYLHGFPDPHIHEYDTLSSEERWNENFDVILANPPFMSPKGGIRPHKKFTINSKRSEVLFVDYIAEHLNPKGRAGIIVPEGVIFQSGTAYKELRKMLVENHLYGVVSLPAGVFNPYSGVKTSILLLDSEIAKKSNEILFIKIENDGYNLGAQRTAVKGGQLEEAIITVKEFRTSVLEGKNFKNTSIAHSVAKTKIVKKGDYNLSGERYLEKIIANSNFPIIKMGELTTVVMGQAPPGKDTNKEGVGTPFVKVGNFGVKNPRLEEWTTKPLKLATSEDTLVCVVGATIGKINKGIDCAIGRSVAAIRPHKEMINEAYLYYNLLEWTERLRKRSQGSAIGVITKEMLNEIDLALPPLSIQEEIVAEIEGYQKIIDGAKAVVENYKPKIDIDPKWEMVDLESIVDIVSGFGFKSSDFNEENAIKCIKITNVGVREFINDDSSRLPEPFLKEYSNYALNTGDLVISLTRTIISSGLKVAIVPDSWNNTLVNQRVAGIKPNGKANIGFIYHYLSSETVFNYVEEKSRSLMQPNLSITDLKKLPIPNPSIELQNEIITQIQKEEQLVEANKKLIEIFDQRIKDKIAKVWGE